MIYNHNGFQNLVFLVLKINIRDFDLDEESSLKSKYDFSDVEK